MKTKLADRTLWFDGTMSVKPNKYLDYASKVEAGKLFVTEINDEIEQFNTMAVGDEQILTKTQMLPYSKKWNIPAEYKELNVFEYIVQKFEKTAELDDLSEDEFDERLTRLTAEYKHFQKKKLVPLLRTLIYVINTFEREKVVWGPGRGSSVSSYLLYVIGVHDVDSVLFGLNITDFLRDIE
ncbi:MAG: hypothetical protein JXR12_15190 [Neptunomonas phycophila]|uniref:hypothetical protein n=1 Tax=Neptunomonas phycophila TaxID=1572645 RepID=UPI003B8E2A84